MAKIADLGAVLSLERSRDAKIQHVASFKQVFRVYTFIILVNVQKLLSISIYGRLCATFPAHKGPKSPILDDFAALKAEMRRYGAFFVGLGVVTWLVYDWSVQ